MKWSGLWARMASFGKWKAGRVKCFLKPVWQTLRDEDGQALAIYVCAVVAVLAFVGLAIDVGQIRYQKRQFQAAADAAAVAGAIEISTCGTTAHCSAMTTAAKQAVTENGITVATSLTQCSTGASGVTLWVNNGPCFLGSSTADPNYGSSSYVEAVVQAPVNMFFARLVGFRTMNVTARAEAHAGPSSQNCLVVGANDTGNSGWGLTLNGGTIDASCGVYDDWNGSGALDEASSSGGVTSTGFKVHGSGCSPCNGGSFGSNSPVYNSPVLTDPLGYLTSDSDAPTAGSCTSQSSTPTSGTTFTQATFCSGFTVNSGTVTLSAGTYYIEGPVLLDSGATLTGTGVTLYFTGNGSLTANSNTSKISLSAPTTGNLAGIAIWQASSDSNAMIVDTGSYLNVSGAIYAPGAQLTMNSSSGTSTAGCTLIDVGQVMLDSGANISLGNSCSAFSGSQAFQGGSVTMAE